jgi:NAD(P)H-hydrate epimerase
MKVSRVVEMRALDRTAFETYGIPEELLMENAGLAVYRVLDREFGIPGKTFVVCCGIGNNGGDGLVIARQLHANGARVKVYVLGDVSKFRGAAQLNLDIVSRLPIALTIEAALPALQQDIAQCDVIVDAIFGTGLTREVDGLYREVIEQINTSGKPVLSVDIPSGVHGETGQIMGTAVRAHYTVTFGLPKPGNLLFPGYELGGKLSVSHISFPRQMYTAATFKLAINHPLPLPPRSRTAHKGSVGDALFIAGAARYFGAPMLAALAFLKGGGGYSRLAAPATMVPFLALNASEIVFLPQRETDAGSIALDNKPALLELAARVDMVVLGPGVSLQADTQQLVRELVCELKTPLLLDGDGITAVCQHLDMLRQRQAATILTPHLGEMARLTALSVGDINANKIDILQQTARDLQAIIVLKGAHSLIGAPDGRVWINMSGNPGMATAGSGDVLTGTIAAMYGLGLALPEAVSMGVFVHGLAGDLAAAHLGEDGMMAHDILAYLPSAVKIVREGLPPDLQARYAGAMVV